MVGEHNQWRIQEVNMTTIVVFGKNGQVGSSLSNYIGTFGDVYFLDRDVVDVTDFKKVKQVLDELKPGVIINAVAYTDVEGAESHYELAEKINHGFVCVLVDYASNHDALLVHYSTDYVYDGCIDGLYCEDSVERPLNNYGKTKALGDQAIIDSGCKYLILRTSWIYSIHGCNFVKAILNNAKVKEELNVVCDQFGSPTSSELVAKITALCVYRCLHDMKAQHLYGVYHLVSKGYANWHEYAEFIINEYKMLNTDLLVKSVTAVSSESYSSIVKRPKNSRLSIEKIERTFGIKMPDWRDEVKRLVSIIAEKEKLL